MQRKAGRAWIKNILLFTLIAPYIPAIIIQLRKRNCSLSLLRKDISNHSKCLILALNLLLHLV